MCDNLKIDLFSGGPPPTGKSSLIKRIPYKPDYHEMFKVPKEKNLYIFHMELTDKKMEMQSKMSKQIKEHDPNGVVTIMGDDFDTKFGSDDTILISFEGDQQIYDSVIKKLNLK